MVQPYTTIKELNFLKQIVKKINLNYYQGQIKNFF
jgi:hypothetical protein